MSAHSSVYEVGRSLSVLIDNRIVQYTLILVILISAVMRKGEDNSDKMTRAFGYVVLAMFLILLYHDFQTAK